MERIVSPGVFTRENDMSFIAQGVAEIGAAFIGPTKQGPAFVPTTVTSATEYEEIFGKADGTYYTDYAVTKYLQETGTATVVRVAGIGGYTQKAPIGLFASQSGVSKLIGVLTSTKSTDPGFTATTLTSLGNLKFGLSGSNLGGVYTSSLVQSDTNDISDVFGTSPAGNKNVYTYTFFENLASGLTTYTASLQVLPDQPFNYDYSEAETPYVKSQLISGERFDLFKFVTLGHGELYNTKYKVGISNVKAAGEDSSTDYSTFTVTIRSYSDTDKRKSVYESFNNVNLDPNSVNYIARRIGDRWLTIDNNGKITENGDYANKSKYVRVVVSDPGTYPVSAAPFGHGAYTNPIITATPTAVPAVVYQSGSISNTTTNPLYFSGFDFETAGVSSDNAQYLKAIPTNASTGSNVDFGFDSLFGYAMTGSNATDMVKRQFVLAFQKGFNGSNPVIPINLGNDITATNTQGHNCSTSTASGSVAYTKAINAISNPDEWDINLVVTPGIIRYLHPSITTAVIDMCEARQDCFYIADFTPSDKNNGGTISTAVDQAASVDSNYVGTYYPWVKTLDTNTNKLVSVPPSVLLPAVYAANDNTAAEWFAPAGLNRGGITGAVSVLDRLTHTERDTLYEGKVNPIGTFPGQGIVAFGQKTLQQKPSALDRINVRRLLIKVKKYIASTSRYLVFEQNTSTTRSKFLNTVNPYMESIQQRQGLYAFRVIMDETNNTPDVVDRNVLAGAIYLQPSKTAEYIVIDFNIMPTTGATFSA